MKLLTILLKQVNLQNPFAVFKPTGLTKFSLLEKINSNQNLKSNEIIEKQNLLIE
ncbi:MAG: hypothetical protein CM15mP112_06190 [Flavobacteriales bacterium]|nr:MAG: hypothetical protein CM15mP112_06190 [Flavobacteriales bacterium]